MNKRLTTAAETVLERRYYLRSAEGELIEDWHDLVCRVVDHVGQNEEPAMVDKFFNMIYELDFLPNSPCLMNAGTELGQLSAYFVLPVEDSMEGIFSAVKNGALVHKTGGGTGYSFSRLRPRNSSVQSTQGVASGPLSFMQVFDAATETIKQGGKRRGANMGVLRVDHPDILDFIDAKEDTTKFTNFNFSVAITDAFMDAVKVHTDYDLIDPSTGEVVASLPAREVFDRIAERAWKTGEPGVLFIDTANKANPTPMLGDYEATNPCWTGDTRVWTIDGPRRFDELAKEGKDVLVLTQGSDRKLTWRTMRNPRMTLGSAPLVRVSFDNGTSVTCTPDHNIYLRSGMKVKAKDLKPGDSIASVYRHKANSKGYLKLSNGVESVVEHHVTAEAKYGRRPDYPGEHCHHIDGDKTNNHPSNLEILPGRKHNSRKMLGEKNPMSGVWDERNPLYGRSVAGKNNPRYRHDIDTDHLVSLHTKGLSYASIGRQVGCSGFAVKKRIQSAQPVNHRVVSVEEVHCQAPVYNGTVDETHSYFVHCGDNDAILSANCGEIWLLPYESCNLGSINLGNFVIDRGAGRKLVDKERLREVVTTAVRFLDNVIDCNRFPIPEIKEATLATRKIGLGIMGLHDMLIQLEVPYDSTEGREIAHKTMEWIREVALNASQALAEERGAYLACEANQFFTRRNATLTSIQPTGTVSMIADCASGCEPYFSLVMVKNVMDGDRLLMVNKHFERVARAEGFYSEALMERVAAKGTVVGDPDVPARWQQIFKCAQDISPANHVAMQATLQLNVDSGISKTINLPADATVDTVRQAYLTAHQLGCKGITVYRDGSRDGQVLNAGVDKPEEQGGLSGPAKRKLPDVLDAKRYCIKGAEGESMYLIICFDENEQPMEVFAKFPFDNRVDLRDRATMWTVTCRLVSLALRSGISMEDVIKQLDRSSGHMHDLPAQLAKLLKSFLANTNHGFAPPCPDCGEPMVYEEGCENCHSCGYSKCS